MLTLELMKGLWCLAVSLDDVQTRHLLYWLFEIVKYVRCAANRHTPIKKKSPFCLASSRNKNVAGSETIKIAGLATSSKTAPLHQTLKSSAALFSCSGGTAMNKHTRIIELNDQLRTTFKGGRVQMTPAVYNLDPQLRAVKAR